MEEVIQGPLARALESGRERFNAKFAAARRARKRLDAAAFATFLSEQVAPLVEAAATAAPEQSGAVADALFDLALTLVGQESPQKNPELVDSWQRLLLGHPELLAKRPAELAGAVYNALYRLWQTPGARAQQFAALLELIDTAACRLDDFLGAGAVAAWRSGLPQLRPAALEACAKLPPEWVAVLLELPPSADTQARALERLKTDPWLDGPAAAARRNGGEIRPVAALGGFTGFGGPFRAPPVVAVGPAGKILVNDGERTFELVADRFGALLFSSEPDAWRNRQMRTRGDLRLDAKGTVRQGRKALGRLPELAGATSSAYAAGALAVTLPLSHRVFLVARVGGTE